MKATLGVLALALGASGALLGVGTLAVGLARHDDRLLRVGRRYVFVVLAAAVLAAAVMEWALITHDFSLQYVADNNALATPLLFTITGLWAALEGSILLWTLVLGGYLAFTAHKFRNRATDPLVRAVSRSRATVHTKLLVAFVGIVALLMVVMVLGLSVLGQSNARVDELGVLQLKSVAYQELQTNAEQVRQLLALRAGGQYAGCYSGGACP